ncbi:PREDICTED: coiled-coil domain-containing protein 134 isoform X1 [Myotis brandtii]|uniref:coiled-coil domain-containing protein 134 isoform X1 n=1 Tax=Myotis brandtii TaxID=109478 RepID=UPI000703FC7D|nr:PREDICTED: coiled-coil domain-containing protein 134 isoform X1 [Myotis brandtii]
MDLLQFLVYLFVLLVSGTGVTDTQRTSVDPSLEIYKKMFEVKRREQLLALKNLVQLNDVHQQYKILDVMLKGLFKVLEDSRTVLLAADVLPDGPFPQDEKLKDAFSQVLENTAFFGDVVLRFPRIVHHYFDHNSNWNLLIRWGISFCNQSGVFDQGPHSPILSLMAQELGISEKDSDFQNPFKVDHTEANKLACHCCTDTDRSEASEFTRAKAVSRLLDWSCWFPLFPESHRSDTEGLRWMPHRQWVCIIAEEY